MRGRETGASENDDTTDSSTSVETAATILDRCEHLDDGHPAKAVARKLRAHIDDSAAAGGVPLGNPDTAEPSQR